jgi:hypothetical protein
MAVELPVQTISYVGRYTLVGDPPVIVLGSLDWSMHPSNDMYFTNIPGKVVVAIRNRDTKKYIKLTIKAGPTVLEYPDELGIIFDFDTMIASRCTNIIGPYSQNFEVNNQIIFLFSMAGALTNVDIAAIRLPE